MSVNETEYYKRMSTINSRHLFIDLGNIFKQVNKGELNSETDDDFLYKCYVDTLIEIGELIKFVFGCFRDGVLHVPRNYSLYNDDAEEDCDLIYSNDKNGHKHMMNANFFKNSVMDALHELDNARMKVAECLLARSNETHYMEMFYVYSGGAHHELGSDNIITNLYRCLRHIHSGDIKFDYKFGDNTHVLYKFDAMFCTKNTVADYNFFVNMRDSFNEKIIEFDPAITNHDKSKYATFKGFVCASTGQAI